MRMHTTCPCGKVMDCMEIIKLLGNKMVWRGNPTTGNVADAQQFWCPYCISEWVLPQARVVGLFHGYSCVDCGGVVGPGVTRSLLQHLQQSSQGYDWGVSNPVNGLPIRFWLPEEGEITEEWGTFLWTLEAVRATVRGARAGSILLEPDEIRCTCQKCVNLRVERVPA